MPGKAHSTDGNAFLLTQETHKGHQVNSLHFGNIYSSSALRDTAMIKIKFLFFVEADRQMNSYKGILSVLCKRTACCALGMQKGSDENCPETPEHFMT